MALKSLITIADRSSNCKSRYMRVILQKTLIFKLGKIIFLSYFFSFFPLEIHWWYVPEGKNAVQPNSYSKWRDIERFEISMTRLMEFHWSGTWKISQIDGIPWVWYLFFKGRSGKIRHYFTVPAESLVFRLQNALYQIR